MSILNWIVKVRIFVHLEHCGLADDDDLENRVSLCGNSYSKVKIYVCFIINCGLLCLLLGLCHLLKVISKTEERNTYSNTKMHRAPFFKVMCSHHDTLLESVDIETNSKIHVLVALIHIYCRFSQTGLVFNCREGICYFMDITDLIMNGTTPDFNDGYSFKLPFNLHKQIKCTYLK